MIIYGKDFRAWEREEPVGTVEEIQELYEKGFSGAYYDTEEAARFDAEMPNPKGEEIVSAVGFAETGKGQLICPFTHVVKAYPGCWPGPAQRVGSCVVHNGRNAILLSLVSDALSTIPDSKTGDLEACPKVSDVAIKNGVLALEPAYRYRGHRSHGWHCGAHARVAVQNCGAVLRQNYPEIGVDLTKMDEGWASAHWDGDRIPEKEKDLFDNNLVHDATRLSEAEAVRDMLAMGFGISTCGGESFSNKRNEDGVSDRTRAGWPHAMACIGCDDRIWAHEKYGGALYLILNSWAVWNSGPRKVHGTDIEIPEGAFWARWKDIKNRDFYAFAGVKGWKRDYKPDWSIPW